MSTVFVHPQGINESDQVGDGTRIWAFAHVMKGARVGGSCNIGEGSFVEGGAVVGNHVTIKNGVAVWDRVVIEDYVFVGPYAVFTNDKIPRSHPDYRTGPSGWDPTTIRTGATIGANATIICGVTLGAWCFVAAGAVVLRNVDAFAMVAGNPARRIGWACKCGRRLADDLRCSCGLRYAARGEGIGPA
jgi:UDP-2-acetamido-3-amino-2,3-dideoxy-glucuronate N-acetyltransferase